MHALYHFAVSFVFYIYDILQSSISILRLLLDHVTEALGVRVSTVADRDIGHLNAQTSKTTRFV